MSQTKLIQALDHFSRLNSNVYIHEPTTTSSSASTTDPSIILLATWLNAAPRHIAKYTAGYAKLYPSARILVLTTATLDAGFRSHPGSIKRIAPVLEILYTLPADAHLLLHVFSNGGAYRMSFVAQCFREKTGLPLPVKAVVFDSAPGRATYEASIRAFAVSLPKNVILRFLGILVLRVVFLWMVLWATVSGKENLIEKTRRALNDESFFSKDAPRLYIYGVADDMVVWKDVEEHLDESKALGYVVETEKFENSSHVGHLMKDEKRYWAAVQRVWNNS